MAKILLEARGILKSYALRTVLDVKSFEIYDGERIGLVGENGAGKSTFIKILSGALEPDSGTIARHAPIHVIAQQGDCADDEFDPALRSEFAAQESREGLSGGEKTRRRIAGALSGRGGILFADEPTTDLDARGVERLEKRLREFDGALVLISHDRALLDSLCSRIVQLEDGRLTSFPGNYTAYRAELENRREHQQFLYDKYRAEEKRIKGMIQHEYEHASQMGRLPKRMGNSEARLHKRETTVAQGKVHQSRKMFESRLAQLEKADRPREDPNIAMKLGAASPVTSKTALEIRMLNLRAGSKTLLENASMRLPVGTKTALMGDNGCGKTTLISRIARDRHNPAIRISPGVKLGWFDQDHKSTLSMEMTALENAMRTSIYPESVVRTILARLGMRGEDVFKPLSVLSGGELAKVALAGLFAADINLLILDEPTNHLDIFTLEALQGVLTEYAGTLLAVSHDRRFVSEVADRLVFFENKRLVSFEGGMDAYRASLAADRARDDHRLDVTRLQMRLAAIAARMSAPKKGDSPEKLNAEYEAVLMELNELKKSGGVKK